MYRLCGLKMQHALFIIIAVSNLRSTTSHRPCEESKNRNGHDSRIKYDCRSRDMVQVPTNISSDATELDLSENKISVIRSNDFVRIQHLRVLELSGNDINMLERRCFLHLKYLERLILNDNNISSFASDVFTGLESLRVLSISRLPLTSYPMQFVTHTPELRVLSLSAIGDATIPVEYARLPQLEVLDFYTDTVKLTRITSAMFNNIRDSNITNLTFRDMSTLEELEAGAFSNLPNLRSLVLACNKVLPYQNTMTSFAATTNTAVETVVLDGTRGRLAIFKEADFCFPFWRRLKRLSIKSVPVVASVFNYAGCLSKLQEFILNYNALPLSKSTNPNLHLIFPSVRTLSVSHMGWHSHEFRKSFCFNGRYLQDVDDYFPKRPPVLPKTKSRLTNNTAPCSEEPLRIGGINVPTSLEFLNFAEISLSYPIKINFNACLSHLQWRFLNISITKFTKVLCSGCHLEGVSRLEILDLSHGVLELITPTFMHNFINLRFLNISHNALGVTGTDFRDTFSYLRLLEDINLSHNKLSQLNPRAFEHLRCLKRLNLADNELTQIDIYMDYLTVLEYIDVSGNRLVALSDAFMSKLDQHAHERPLMVNLQREMFMCNCKSVSFIRWIRVTQVQIEDKERLTCSYGDSSDTFLRQIDVGHIEDECHVAVLPIVVPIFAVVIFGFIVALLVRYHRWYLKYHLVLCWLRDGMASFSKQQEQHDAMVLYFLHSTNPRDQVGGVARISRWVCMHLLPRAEEEWGLRLYVGDRDDVGGASKMQNFVRGFRSSDKVVVCLTREFIDDSDCMNYLATALDSSKPLSKYIFVLFDDVQPTSVPCRLRQLLLPNAPSVMLTWGEIEDQDEHAQHTYWRRMRHVLTRDPDQKRCRRHFDIIPLLVLRQENIDEFERQ